MCVSDDAIQKEKKNAVVVTTVSSLRRRSEKPKPNMKKNRWLGKRPERTQFFLPNFIVAGFYPSRCIWLVGVALHRPLHSIGIKLEDTSHVGDLSYSHFAL